MQPLEIIEKINRDSRYKLGYPFLHQLGHVVIISHIQFLYTHGSVSEFLFLSEPWPEQKLPVCLLRAGAGCPGLWSWPCWDWFTEMPISVLGLGEFLLFALYSLSIITLYLGHSVYIKVHLFAILSRTLNDIIFSKKIFFPHSVIGKCQRM